MADYQLTNDTSVLRVADQAWIPDDPGNRDRQKYNDWLAAGGVPDPVKPAVDSELDSVGTGKTINQILGVT